MLSFCFCASKMLVNPFGAVTLSREIPQSVIATLTQTGVMEKSTPSGLIHKQSRQIAVVDVGQQGPIPEPVHQRTINEHQFLTHPNCRDARSSVRKRRGTVSGPFTNVSKPHLLLGCLLAVHLAMRIKDAGQPLRG